MEKTVKERKCQACGKIQNRENMFKITRHLNKLILNPSSKELGRSMYVCKNEECIKTLIKKKRIRGALKYTNQEEIKRIEEELLKIF